MDRKFKSAFGILPRVENDPAKREKAGADMIHQSESPLPMNIQKNRWSSLIDKKPEDMYDADTNIEAASVLIRRISDRIERPTPEKVGSVWNYIGRESTNDFGDYVGRIYKEKPWRKIE